MLERKLDYLIDKTANEIIKNNNLELNATNVVDTVRVLESVPQVKILRRGLTQLDIIKNNFKIELFVNANNKNAISIYSDTDKYAVVKEITKEEAKEFAEALAILKED